MGSLERSMQVGAQDLFHSEPPQRGLKSRGLGATFSIERNIEMTLEAVLAIKIGLTVPE